VGTAHQFPKNQEWLIRVIAGAVQPPEDCGESVGVPIGWVFGISLVARRRDLFGVLCGFGITRVVPRQVDKP